MKRLLLILIVLAIAVGIGLSIHKNPGLMVIAVAGWRIDLPLWMGLLGILLFYITMHYAWCLLHTIVHIPGMLTRGVKNYQLRRAKRATEQGFVAYIMGDYKRAQKALHKGMQHSAYPWLNAVFAAKAANALHNIKKRDQFLQQANHLLIDAPEAVLFTLADLEYKEGEYTQSKMHFEQLQQCMPNHPVVKARLAAISQAMVVHDEVDKR